jgi:hypothetical protein
MEGPHCSFRPDPLANMAAIGDSCFRLADFKKNVWPNVPKLGRKHLWKVLCCDCLCRSDPLTILFLIGLFCRMHLWEVLYKDYSFRPYQLTNMAATGKSCFLLVNF